MQSRKKNIWILIGIVVLTTIAGFFIYPFSDIKGISIKPFNIGEKVLPWNIGLDLAGGVHLLYEVNLSEVEASDRESVLNGLRDVMERRVNRFGVSEPIVEASRAGESARLVVELAGISDPQAAIEQIGRTAFLDFREIQEIETPPELIGSTSTAGESETMQVPVPTELTGRYLTKASVSLDQVGQPQIELNFNSEGGRLFEEITGRNVGKPLAIFIDNELISAPVVQQRIAGGNAVITGVSAEEATAITNLLNAGALPAPIELMSQFTVGASLGNEFLKTAVAAGAYGTLLVLIFMPLYYRGMGFFATIALICYVILTLALFKGIGMTLTLAGIAGFILSIGMAVDANILIFERTKEEIKRGLTKVSALEEGFRRAWPSIRDSNITTIITAIILYFFTTSFVKGFALALLFGVLVSMFSAITITRTLLRAFIK